MNSDAVRALLWADICARHTDPALRLSAWQQTEVTGHVADGDWADEHAGTCHCKAAARLYPGGWFCDDHKPSTVSTERIR